MQEGWECQKCHNVYAPNVPFCLYCWFQNNNNNNNNNENTQINKNETTVQDENITINIPIKENEDKKDNIENINNTNNININKELYVPKVDIEIPKLNKINNYPLSNKYPDTKIFLAGVSSSKERTINRSFKIPYILDSIMDFPIIPSKIIYQYFEYIKRNNIEYLLDSGAFTYLKNPKKKINLNDHIQRYCYYINEFDIKQFFELDIDSFLSIEEIENIRKKIYLETHKQPIIVYHEARGHDYWINMCKENEFIAIGGLVTDIKTNTVERQKHLSILCDEAHSYGTKVHGLGFTPLSLLNSRTMFFDTVDSTTWTYARWGETAEINEKGELIRIEIPTPRTLTEAREHDLEIWTKFITNYHGALK